MAYDSTIPSLSNLIGDDIPQMQENFQLLEDSQVVDEGSTADGDYIRYENGWQICAIKEFLFNSTVGTHDRLEYNKWDYPVPFDGSPSYIGSHVLSTYYYNQTDLNDEDASYLTQVIARDPDSSSSTRLRVGHVEPDKRSDFRVSDGLKGTAYAIGRWK